MTDVDEICRDQKPLIDYCRYLFNFRHWRARVGNPMPGLIAGPHPCADYPQRVCIECGGSYDQSVFYYSNGRGGKRPRCIGCVMTRRHNQKWITRIGMPLYHSAVVKQVPSHAIAMARAWSFLATSDTQAAEYLKANMQMIDGELRINASALAHALGISQSEMHDLMLRHSDELLKMGPIVQTDASGNVIRKVEHSSDKVQ